MANTFTRYTSKNLGTTPVVLVTAASATQTTVIGFTASNTTASPITVDVYITASATNYYLVKGKQLSFLKNISWYKSAYRKIKLKSNNNFTLSERPFLNSTSKIWANTTDRIILLELMENCLVK